MRAFVHEQRLPGRDTVNIDPMLFEVVREWLLDVQQHPVQPGVLLEEPIYYRVDVRRLADGAIEVGSQPVDRLLNGNPADRNQSIVIPRGVVATQLDLEAFQAV